MSTIKSKLTILEMGIIWMAKIIIQKRFCEKSNHNCGGMDSECCIHDGLVRRLNMALKRWVPNENTKVGTIIEVRI